MGLKAKSSLSGPMFSRAVRDDDYLKVEVKLNGVRDRLVDDKPSRAVSALPVTIIGVLREEPNVVTLADDDDSDLGLDVELLASG